MGKAYEFPVSKPSITEREREFVSDVMSSGWISSLGPYVERFERDFAKWNGKKYGVACSSGTSALTIALRALGMRPGDEVIVPEFTMIATAWAVTYTGDKPVFVDCGDDLNIDPELIERKITPQTRAIVPVHVYGRSCNMERILDLAYEHNMDVVEDSAEAHGIKPKGSIACFSLFANKIITAGEGGICVTDDEGLAKQMAHLRAMAFDTKHTFLHKKLGYNFRMTNLQAALATAQTSRVDEILKKRKEIEERYDEGLRGIKGITLMPKRDVLWMYDLLAEDRDGLAEHLDKEGIETRVFFRPMSQQPMYFNPDWLELKAASFASRGLYLPTYTDLTGEDQKFITGKVREFYGSRNK